jgi:hypothetical protein
MGLLRTAKTTSPAVLKGDSGRTISAIWFSNVWQIGSNDLGVYPTLVCITGRTECTSAGTNRSV